MNKRKERAKKFRRNLTIWVFASQMLGIVGALTVGTFFDAGVDGCFWGYGLGVLLSLGCTFG